MPIPIFVLVGRLLVGELDGVLVLLVGLGDEMGLEELDGIGLIEEALDLALGEVVRVELEACEEPDVKLVLVDVNGFRAGGLVDKAGEGVDDIELKAPDAVEGDDGLGAEAWFVTTVAEAATEELEKSKPSPAEGISASTTQCLEIPSFTYQLVDSMIWRRRAQSADR